MSTAENVLNEVLEEFWASVDSRPQPKWAGHRATAHRYALTGATVYSHQPTMSIHEPRNSNIPFHRGNIAKRGRPARQWHLVKRAGSHKIVEPCFFVTKYKNPS